MGEKQAKKSAGKALVNGVQSYFNVPEHKADPERMSPRNMVMFGLGTFGRDFLYNLFATYLMTYIMFTRTLTDAQFGIVTIIIIAARIFDAFNDPIMGGIVENTRSKWGKFKPWQFIGAILTGGVIIAVFSNKLQGDDFLIILGVLYFLFSITYTMNDISYWGMLPSLSSNEQDRGKLTSFAQLVANAGVGLAGILIPPLTAGDGSLGTVNGYMIISIVAVVLMIGFQMFTVFGVKEKPIDMLEAKKPRMTLKDMFKVLFKNDQLMWSTLIMLIFSVGTGVVNAGLLTNYIFFEFGYNGMYTIFIFVLSAVATVVFTALYPKLAEKYSRNKLLYLTGFSMILGYILMMIFGLAIPHSAPKSALWYTKFALMILCNGFVGFGQGFYMIMLLSMTNTVEYNEWKTGDRKEGLIVSLRPFTAKLSTAINQGLVSLVFIVAGALEITNQISTAEQQYAENLKNMSAEAANAIKDGAITSILGSIDPQVNMIICACMCLFPIVFMTIALIIYKKKYILDDKKYAEICAELEVRRKQNAIEAGVLQDAEVAVNEAVAVNIDAVKDVVEEVKEEVEDLSAEEKVEEIVDNEVEPVAETVEAIVGNEEELVEEISEKTIETEQTEDDNEDIK